MNWMILTDTLLELALRSSIVIALAALIVLMLRRAPAMMRHTVWVVAILVLAALPFAVGLAPAVGDGLIDLGQAVPFKPEQAPVDVQTIPAAPEQVAPAPPAPKDAQEVAGAISTGSEGRAGMNASAIVSVLWLLGSVLTLSVMIFQWGVTAWTLRGRALFASDMPVDTGGVAVFASDRVRVPFVWGIVRPFIVMPTESDRWSQDRLSAVLLHELAHIRRHDVLTRTIGCLAAAMFWCNPLAWFALSRLEAESESACDDAVVASGMSATDYARHLVAVAASMSRRMGVVGAVGMARQPQVEKRLRRLLDPRRVGKGTSLIARIVAIVLLVGLSVPVATVRIVASPTVQVQSVPDGMTPAEYAVQELDKIGTPGTDALARAIEAHDWLARKGGNDRVRIDIRAVDPLIIGLEDDDHTVRRLAAWGLGETGEDRAVDALLRMLHDDVAAVRAQAAWSLGDIGSDAATSGLMDALGDDDAGVRLRTAHALGDIADPRAAEVLRDAHSDSDERVREKARWALREINEQRVQENTLAAMNNDDTSLRVMAAHEMGDRRSDESVPALVAALSDPEVEMREKAAWALGEIRSPQATEPLIACARNEDENTEVRRQAIRALGEIGDPRALDPLLALLEHDTDRLRSQAADALGDIGDTRALDPLKHAYKNDSSSSVRGNADKAISKIVRDQR